MSEEEELLYSDFEDARAVVKFTIIIRTSEFSEKVSSGPRYELKGSIRAFYPTHISIDGFEAQGTTIQTDYDEPYVVLESIDDVLLYLNCGEFVGKNELKPLN